MKFHPALVSLKCLTDPAPVSRDSGSLIQSPQTKPAADQLRDEEQLGWGLLTDLVEGDDVAGLDVLLSLLSSAQVILDELVDGHLLVLNRHQDVQLVDAVADGEQLGWTNDIGQGDQ